MRNTRKRYIIGVAVQVAAIGILTFALGQGCGQFKVGDFSSSFRWVDDGRGSFVQWVPSQRQLRLLSPSELSSTYSSLTGTGLSDSINYGDHSNGYDTGSGQVLDASIYEALLNDVEGIAENYIDTELKNRYTCFDGSWDEECFQTWLSEFTAQAYRGSVVEDDLATLNTFYNRASIDTDRTTALKLLVTRILMSPKVLYRTEMGVFNPETETYILTDLEKASLISYSVTGSPPDSLLLQDAMAGNLTEEVLKSHVKRLLNSEEGKDRVHRFFQSWLKVEALREMKEYPENFPKFESTAIPRAVENEFNQFIESVVYSETSTLSSLFLSSYTFVNQVTAPLYNKTSNSSAFERVELDPSKRLGVLTLASVMAVHSAASEIYRESPTERGLLVKEQLLCEPVGLPSGISTDEATEDALLRYPNFADFTVRRQFEVMMEQGPSCIACHAQFMPFGFMFGNYNALGAFVTEQKDQPIDPTVTGLRGGGELKTTYDSGVQLIRDLASDTRVSDCFARNFVKYTLGYPAGLDVDSLSHLMGAKLFLGSYGIMGFLEELYSSSLLFERRDTGI